ncbi:MAG: Fur family transcriptional regulator [bacterium]
MASKKTGTGPPWWKERLQRAGSRITAPREAILKFLNQTAKHLSAEDIYLVVHKAYPNIGLTTVYRTLELLVQTGLIFKVDFGDGRARYELADGPKGIGHHHHLVCTSCGRVIDYTEFINEEKEFLAQTERGLTQKYHFTITNHLIQFYGLCDKCQG